MWRLVRAELAYHRLALLAIVGLAMPVLAGYSVAMEGTPIEGIGLVAPTVVAWALSGTIVETRNRERRERHLALLPLTAHQVALARLAACAIPPTAALVAYGVAHTLLKGGAFPASRVQMGLGWIVLVLGLLLIAQDLFLWSPRPGSSSSKSTLARLAVGPMVAAGLVLLIVSLQRLQAPAVVTVAADAVRAFLAAPQGPTRFLSLTCVFAFLTVLTFARRRSYLQK